MLAALLLLLALAPAASAAPSPIDRVMGLWRPIPRRSAEPAKRALRSVAARLNHGKSDRVKIAAMRAAAQEILDQMQSAFNARG